MRIQKLARPLSLALVVSAIGLGAVALPVGAASAGGKSAAGATRTNSAYIVQMADMPVTAYTGGIKGYAATKPGKGKKIDPNSPGVVSYKAYLEARHNTLLATVGGGRKLHSYGYVFNGFAADLTPAQAQRMAQLPGVLAVTKDEARQRDTSSTPTFLGLNGPTGVWEATGATGENVIIGIVDGGAWPEHLSLSDRTGSNGNASKDGKLSYQQIPGWHGKCVPGEAFAASNCNQKLIGARYYNEGWGGNAGIDAQLPWEFNSPRDYGGHGTHTATTSGGNAGVPATGAAAAFGDGKISGIAPRARIASYKVCWETGAGGSCFTTDSVAAIDQAVADGVDVINFSISGSQTNFRDPVEIAFLFAADAGVFVAASAGNSGPTGSTVAHPGPWLTTVAAGTHNRAVSGSATLGNASIYSGASVATLVKPKALIDAETAGLPGANANAVRLCFSAADNGGTPVLDPAKIANKIVVCDRGSNARVAKSAAVAAAGGVGMILLNTSTSSLNADLHLVPTVHLQNTDRAAVKAYAATPGAIATINAATFDYASAGPYTAEFSSRGPLLASQGDVLKPDLIAPGQDILAGVAPPGNFGKLFDVYSGTSMSSPHVAGLAALFKQKYPNWSPMAIKSALMTTGYDVLDTGVSTATRIFRQGAGHVDPNKAMNPGLVFDAGWNDWIGFLCGAQPGGGCTGVTPMKPSDLNVASIAIGAMAGTQTVKRRVTNVGSTAATYSATHTGMTGITVTVSPSSFTLAPGATQEFTVAFSRTDAAALDAYAGGQLSLTAGSTVVRVPMVVRPVALAAPAEVSGSYNVTFGYTGPFTATARGLVPATVTPGSVTQDPDQTFDPTDATGTGTVAISVVIPAGTTYARYALFDADVSPGSDLDMYVYQGSTLVGQSTTGTSAEAVSFSFANPAAAPIALTVYVHGWGAAGGTSPFKLHDWAVGTAAAGNMTVTAPGSATLAGSGTISISTIGLTAGTKYLGSIAYGGAASLTNPTIVRIGN